MWTISTTRLSKHIEAVDDCELVRHWSCDLMN